MPNDVRHVLHTIHAATNDVLAGYETMLDRADPDILPIIEDLSNLHRCHAMEQEDALQGLQDTGDGDATVRGTVNKAVVTLRDWVAGLDADALPAVREDEEALMDIYDKSLAEWTVDGHFDISEFLTRQYHEIKEQISGLLTGKA
ncbi:DUF2383 domain-containing protein [Loktanella sp. M215]|uniref:DUF2383 domain-containing protein n=1 Tax=Loktanella sp. M215 TaxID=2675431 RepID=UPI001F2592DA|nr:DUF2383 domain-containing protein [Loktanella sp. M215]